MQDDETNVFQSPDPQLPPYGYALQTPGHGGSSTPPSIPKASTKKRKLSSFGDPGLEYEGLDDHDGSANGLTRNGSNRKSRQNGTKRACNQCRQQKVSHAIHLYTLTTRPVWLPT
jgi:hypothetical protein